jgi:hypothetical protein
MKCNNSSNFFDHTLGFDALPFGELPQKATTLHRLIECISHHRWPCGHSKTGSRSFLARPEPELFKLEVESCGQLVKSVAYWCHNMVNFFSLKMILLEIIEKRSLHSSTWSL